MGLHLRPSRTSKELDLQRHPEVDDTGRRSCAHGLDSDKDVASSQGGGAMLGLMDKKLVAGIRNK